MSENLAYKNYSQRKQLLATGPHFPVKRWWDTEGFCEAERIFFEAVRGTASLLDVGTGDLRVMKKFRAAGYQGRYETLDAGTEYRYTFNSLQEVKTPYEAILCLDVIEHLPLHEGLKLIMDLIGLLCPGGTLVLQTPNARCIHNPLSWDMTHVHIYNLNDLWAYFVSLGMTTHGYRVLFAPPRFTAVQYLRYAFGAYLIGRVLHADYAHNILVIAQKPGTLPAT